MLEWIIIGTSGIVIGSVFGLIGAGGAMLAIPVLVYFLGYTRAEAMGASLLIVLLSALTGAWRGWQKREASLVHACVYGIIGGIFAWGSAHLAPSIPELWRGLGFAAILIAAAITMLRSGTERAESPASPNVPDSLSALGLEVARESPIAAAIGVLSGILGVGGGFLLVPVLHRRAGLSFSSAVATSLLTVIANSLFGFLGALPFLLESRLRWWPILGMAAVALLFSQWIALHRSRFPETKLRLGFALMLLGLAIAEVWHLYAVT